MLFTIANNSHRPSGFITRYVFSIAHKYKIAQQGMPANMVSTHNNQANRMRPADPMRPC